MPRREYSDIIYPEDMLVRFGMLPEDAPEDGLEEEQQPEEAAEMLPTEAT